MADIMMLGVAALVIILVFVRRTSAGVAILGLLAGVLLDQLLGSWIINLLPPHTATASSYVPVIVHLLLTFVPMLVSLFTVKVHRSNPVLALLTSVALGILIVFFGLQIVEPLAIIPSTVTTSGFLVFLQPYHNAILAGSAVLAVVEMAMSHQVKKDDKKKKG